MQNKSILIAGATGMIGRALIPALIEQGFSIKILTRNIDKARKIFPGEVAIFKWPEGNIKAFIGNSEACYAVINLVGANIGEKRWTKKYKQRILDSRVSSIVNLEKIVKQMPNKPKVWIQASAIGYYNDVETELGKSFLSNVVVKWEKAFLNVKLTGIRKVTLRFGVVISKKQGMLYKMIKAFNWGLAVCPGTGKQMLSWVHIHDLVNIITGSVKNDNWTGQINAVAPNAISFWELAKQLQQQTRALLAIKVPAAIIQFVLGYEKANDLLLASKHVKPEQLIEYNFKYKFQYFKDALKE